MIAIANMASRWLMLGWARAFDINFPPTESCQRPLGAPGRHLGALQEGDLATLGGPGEIPGSIPRHRYLDVDISTLISPFYRELWSVSASHSALAYGAIFQKIKSTSMVPNETGRETLATRCSEIPRITEKYSMPISNISSSVRNILVLKKNCPRFPGSRRSNRKQITSLAG